jgi:uncharacterized membrane protein YdjX (TVP38/TMEM64 family)
MTKVTTKTEQRTDSLRQYGARALALAFWLTLLIGYWLYARQQDLTIQESLRQLAFWLTGSLYGPLVFIVLYMLRPLLFFPATIITLLGGFLFGPILGVVYVILGSNSSAMLAYGIGRYFGQDILDEEGGGIIQGYAQAMRHNSFETVLIMRLIFLPYDLVHYVAGFLKIDWRAFLLATIIGSVPGTISFVLFGASFGTLDELLLGEATLNPVALAISIGLIVISIAISRYLKRRNIA